MIQDNKGIEFPLTTASIICFRNVSDDELNYIKLVSRNA